MPAQESPAFSVRSPSRSLARAPVIIFDRPDRLQAKWAHEIKARLTAPMHRIPSTREFLGATLACEIAALG